MQPAGVGRGRRLAGRAAEVLGVPLSAGAAQLVKSDERGFAPGGGLPLHQGCQAGIWLQAAPAMRTDDFLGGRTAVSRSRIHFSQANEMTCLTSLS